MAFRRVAALAEIPAGRGTFVKVDGVEVGLFRAGERVYAIDNACPHAGYPLSEGELDGTIVICCAHGWEFDLESGTAPQGQAELLTRYAVRVEAGEVWVDLEQRPAAAVPAER